MKRLAVSIALSVGFTALYLSGLAAVPFHPDESSQLSMSRDFDLFFLQRNFDALAWTPDQPLSPEARLRLLDAPITKYLIGLGWWSRGYSSADLNADWVWGEPWDANLAALPRPQVLVAGRTPLAVLGALAAVILFWLGNELGGWGVGLAGALLLGLNPLTLLHTRRAMAEGSLIFFSALAAWGALRLTRTLDSLPAFQRRTLMSGALAGVLAGLAAASKQTELVMLPVVLLMSAASLFQKPWSLRPRALALIGVWPAVGLGWGLTFWALNPVLYRQPVAVAWKMIEMRAELARQQIEVNGQAHPEMLTPAPLARLTAALSQIYVRPPAFWDAPVYLDRLGPPAEAYLALPLNRVWPQPMMGYALGGLSAVGVIASAHLVLRQRFNADTRPAQVLWAWTLLTLGLLLWAIPLDWQRYFLPLLPPACLFAAYGLVTLVRLLRRRFARATG
jgi:4-amino-4-deoxy-L-arabinose transferase-like glycosyltransferase